MIDDDTPLCVVLTLSDWGHVHASICGARRSLLPEIKRKVEGASATDAALQRIDTSITDQLTAIVKVDAALNPPQTEINP